MSISIMELSTRAPKSVKIAMMASLFKEEVPWLYELGMEAFRDVSRGNSAKARKSVQIFVETCKSTLGHPLFRGKLRKGEEVWQMIDEFMYILVREFDEDDSSDLI